MRIKGLLIGLAALVAITGCAPTELGDMGSYQPPRSQPAPSTPMPGAGAGPGAMCGGIAALPCGDGLFCAVQPGACRTMADVAGQCAPRPQACTRQYEPVCGCDGRTYGNACDAASNGASIAAPGECPR